jgi:hypothetical protein
LPFSCARAGAAAIINTIISIAITRISFLMPFLLSLDHPCGIAWSCLPRHGTQIPR